MSRLAVAVLLAITAIVAADEAKPATHQIKLDGQTFTLPVGFTIERVAGPPLVDRPIVASFDDRGRLYVADSSGSNEKPAEQLKHPDHRIIRLKDTKGTGVFDKATVFADKMMFPEGILWHRGSVFVGAPPHIWKLTDTDDDGVADKREVWFDGKTVTGCANDLHGPYLGPDGWIYWCKGAFAKQEYTLPNGKKFTTRASHIFRARPDGTGIEPVMTGGMDNPVGVAFLPNGERFFTTTFLQHPAAGKRDGIIHAIYGGIYGKDHDVIYDPDHKWTSPTAMPVMTHLGPAAPCGLHCYESNAFGPEYTSNLFACQFNLRRVSRHVLKPSGSTYTTEDSDFLVSDSQDFHPTDVIEDADGSLLVVNTGGWYKLCCPSSQLVKADVLGAIYRVRRVGAHNIDDPRGRKLDWQKLSFAEAVKLLTDPRPAVRASAADELARRGPKAVEWVPQNLVGAHRPAPSACWELWVLSRIDDKAARQWIRSALSMWDDEVLVTACQSVAISRDPLARSLLEKALANAPGLDRRIATNRARRAAAEAIGRIGSRESVPTLLGSLDDPRIDRELEHSVTYALIEIADVEGLSAGLKSDSVRVRRACLAALDQLGEKLDPKVVLEAMKSKDAALKETAFWIMGRHPEWAAHMVKVAGERYGPDMVPVLARFARDPAVEKVLLSTLSAKWSPENHYPMMHAMYVMARAGGKEMPRSWADAIGNALKFIGPDGDISSAAFGALKALPPKPGATVLEKELREIYSYTGFTAGFRLKTMSVFPGGMTKLTEEEFKLVVSALDREREAEVRAYAAEVLSKAKLNTDQLIALIAALSKVSPLELDRVLAAFAQTKDEAIGLKLLAAMNTPEVRPALRTAGVRERIKHFGPAVQKEAEKLYAALNVEYEQQRAKLDETVKTLKVGDVRRGQAVFNSTKTSCIACHTIGYVGGKIGPDLTRIGSLRNERDLLESILFPSASFVRSYEPLTVRTKDGKVFNGIPKKDAPDEIVLILAADKEQRIAREDIEDVQPGKVSIMPAGLDKQLSEQELADLIAFLRACK